MRGQLRTRGFERAMMPLLVSAIIQVVVAVSTDSSSAAEHGFGSGPRSPEELLLRQFNLDELSINRDEVRAGGPPKDGIPALRSPKTVPVAQAAFLRPDDRVVGVNIEEDARAYPIRLLNYHEAINDTLGGVPIAVIYCPLCDSVSVVDRRVTKDKTVEFGISGLLLNSNVLLYDRTDQALWSQVGLTALSGPHVGKPLVHLPWDIMPFGQWRKAHPKGTVATFSTGHRRDYRLNPYAGYFTTDRLMFPVVRQDNRLPPKARIVGVRLGASVRAYPLDRIAGAAGGRIEDEIGGKPLVLEAGGTATIRVVQMPEEAQAIHTFWFAWAAFHPRTEVFGERPPASASGATRSSDR